MLMFCTGKKTVLKKFEHTRIGFYIKDVKTLMLVFN